MKSLKGENSLKSEKSRKSKKYWKSEKSEKFKDWKKWRKNHFLTLEDVPDSWDGDENPKWIQCDLRDHTFHVEKDCGWFIHPALRYGKS